MLVVGGSDAIRAEEQEIDATENDGERASSSAGRVGKRRTFKEASASTEEGTVVATAKRRAAAKRDVKKAASAATSKRSNAHLPAATRSALGKQGAAVAKRKRSGGASPKTRQELYEEARRRNISGRSKMGRAELARALGERA